MSELAATQKALNFVARLSTNLPPQSYGPQSLATLLSSLLSGALICLKIRIKKV
jgi:hypothetical protein